jgi:hypothetical protein
MAYLRKLTFAESRIEACDKAWKEQIGVRSQHSTGRNLGARGRLFGNLSIALVKRLYEGKGFQSL